MQGVHCPIVDGLVGSQNRLGKHLSAEYSAGPDVAADATKQVDLKLFQLHQAEQFLKCFLLMIHCLLFSDDWLGSSFSCRTDTRRSFSSHT